MSIEKKIDDLKAHLKKYQRCAIAFSGGVDSTFLLAAARRFLGKENVIAFTVKPPYVPNWEFDEAKEFATEQDAIHITIETPIPDVVKNNPNDRCYLCKHKLFGIMKEAAAKRGISIICDGSNLDDLDDFRPGMKALKELGVESPLLLARLTKEDIRKISREWGLPTWNKAPYACLLTRIPHNQNFNEATLKQIEKAELFLISRGFNHVRVRHHGDTARIEMPPEQFEEFHSKGTAAEAAVELKSLGYKHICLDLEGYRMGNMNT